MGGRIAIEDRGPLRVLTIDNPAKRNAVDDGMIEHLAAALSPGATAGVRCLLVRGSGDKAFCAGYDLTGLQSVPAGGALPDARLAEVLTSLQRHPIPSVALVTGPAFGAGFELAVACDFRVGASGATFCMPPARLGIAYSLDGLQRFTTLLGRARAKRVFLTGKRIEAREALELGILDELRDEPGDAEGAAIALCDELLQGAPRAISAMKTAIESLAPEPDIRARTEFDAWRRQLFNSDDAREGRAAFLEKRKPVFTGR